MHQSELQESLNRLYARPAGGRITCLISGPWGVGKTFSVNRVLRELTATDKPRPSYSISVFGRSSISDLLESLWLEVLKKNVGIENKKVGAVAKYLRSAFDIFKGQFAGAASAISTLQKSMLDDIIKEGTILVVDDLERKSPSLEMVDLLSFIEMYREKCSVIAIGNIDALTANEKEVFGRYSERLFDQQYLLTEVSDEVLDRVLNNNAGSGISAETRKSIVGSFKRSGDANMRTLLKIGIVATETYQQLAAHGSGDLLRGRDFVPSLVALMVEKHSKAKDISPLLQDRSFLAPDDRISAFLKQYALPTRIGFSLAPFVELIEHKRLVLEELRKSLGVEESDQLQVDVHTVVFFWCSSVELVRNAWNRVCEALNGTAIHRFTLREIVDFAYASTSVRTYLPDLFIEKDFETWILERLTAASTATKYETLERQFESVKIGYEALKEKPLIDKMAAVIKKAARTKRSRELKAQFDREYGEQQYYRAFRLVEDEDFPAHEISDILVRSGQMAIPDEYFFALKTVIKDLRASNNKMILTEELSALLKEAKDPLVRTRIQSLLGIAESDKT